MARKRNPLPADAKRVFKGVMFEVWQWQQKMFDGSTETFERLKRPDTAVIIATVGSTVLVQQQEQPDSVAPFVSLAGGRCEDGEEPLAAAKRELLEEAGYTSDDWQLWMEVNPVGKIEWTVYYFIARDCVRVAEPHLDAGEKIKPRLVSFEEFLALSDEPSFSEREIVPELLRMRLDPVKHNDFKKILFG